MGNNLYKQRHREKGLCVDCSRKALPGQIRCKVHLLHHRDWKEDRFKNKVRKIKFKKYWEKNNLCNHCGAPLEDTKYKTCMNCRQRVHRPHWAYWHELAVRGIL